jgi:hypothetical protein
MRLGVFAIAVPRRRKLLSCCLLFVVAAGCALQSACGTSSKKFTPAGSYTITVTGTAGATQQTIAVTLTVT